MNSIQNEQELAFAVFCIENVADYLKVNAADVFRIFTEQSDILNNYIVKNYDVLHTQGKEYIIEDIVEVMKERNVLDRYLHFERSESV